MRQVGSRRAAPITTEARAESLIEGARFNEALAWLSRARVMPKGVYRYRSHEEANQHELDCLVQALARRALEGGQ